MPTQLIDIFHHVCDTIDDRKLVYKEFLGLTSKLVNTSVILKYFLNCDTIADLVELLSSQIFTAAKDFPSPTHYFTNERVIVNLKRLIGTRAKKHKT